MAQRYTEGMGTVFTPAMKESVDVESRRLRISQAEFIRRAVRHYLSLDPAERDGD